MPDHAMELSQHRFYTVDARVYPTKIDIPGFVLYAIGSQFSIGP